jgi:hypothetical protein
MLGAADLLTCLERMTRSDLSEKSIHSKDSSMTLSTRGFRAMFSIALCSRTAYNTE